MKLLLVDDNAEIRRLLRRVLADLSADIAECTDGSEVLSAYTQEHPDWVLMDIEIGQIDGITATRQIRAADPAAHILIVTSHDNPALRAAAQAAGACGYVLKENLLELRQRLKTLRQSESKTETTNPQSLPLAEEGRTQ